MNYAGSFRIKEANKVMEEKTLLSVMVPDLSLPLFIYYMFNLLLFFFDLIEYGSARQSFGAMTIKKVLDHFFTSVSYRKVSNSCQAFLPQIIGDCFPLGQDARVDGSQVIR